MVNHRLRTPLLHPAGEALTILPYRSLESKFGRPVAHETIARPLTGEVLTVSGRPATLDARSGDIVDAEFEVVATAPTLAAAQANPPTLAAPSGLRGLVPAKPPGFLARPGGTGFWTAGLGLAAATFWASGGHALVRPAFMVPPPSIEIRITDVTSRIEAADGRIHLFVEGTAVNDGTSLTTLPQLEIAIAQADGEVTRYRLAKSPERLAPGARTPFSSRLDLPKNGVSAVTVTVVR